MAVAENMADLVDGYCRLVNQSPTSIWSRKGEDRRTGRQKDRKTGGQKDRRTHAPHAETNT